MVLTCSWRCLISMLVTHHSCLRAHGLLTALPCRLANIQENMAKMDEMVDEFKRTKREARELKRIKRQVVAPFPTKVRCACGSESGWRRLETGRERHATMLTRG